MNVHPVLDFGNEDARSARVHEADAAVGGYDGIRHFGNGARPDAEPLHEAKETLCDLFAVVLGDAHAHARFDDEAGRADAVERVRERALEHRGGRMDPDEVAVELLGERNQPVGRIDVDAHLRNFAQEDVRRVNVDGAGRALHVGNDLGRDDFLGRAVGVAGEDAVHVKVKARNAAGDGVDAERIERRIDVDDARQMLGMLGKDPVHAPADVLAFELVAVRARHDADAGQIRGVGFLDAGRKKAIFADHHFFRHRHVDGDNVFDHGCEPQAAAATSASVRMVCCAAPRKTPRSSAASAKSQPRASVM